VVIPANQDSEFFMGRATRVLIVSASTGNGHLRAGEALKAAARVHQPNWRVEHLDVLTLAPRWLRKAYGGGFELLAARAPRVWGGIYRWSDGPEGDRARWGAVAERTVFRSFRRLLLQGGWDLCLCTHFLPAQLAAGRSGMPPFALVVTDFTLHRYWTQPRVHRYFVPTDAFASDVRARIPGAVVDVTGIPVDPAFSQPLTQPDARRQMGLDPDRPVITLMGGGLGLGIEENLDQLLQCGVDEAQIMVICGRNASVRERLEQRGLPERVHVVGFVSGIERIFAASDVVVTKPGGLTTSEALAVGRPLLLTRPLPGHERANAALLENLGAAAFAQSPSELREKMLELFREPGRLAAMTGAAQAAGRPTAAKSVLQHVEHYVNEAVAA
jgi:processive 1,2-diacylglycerol beta-glucosyltransferase